MSGSHDLIDDLAGRSHCLYLRRGDSEVDVVASADDSPFTTCRTSKRSNELAAHRLSDTLSRSREGSRTKVDGLDAMFGRSLRNRDEYQIGRP